MLDGATDRHPFDPALAGVNSAVRGDALGDSGLTPADVTPLPELFGYGLAPVGGKYLAVKLSTRGAVDVLTPEKGGEHAGESKHAALARLLKAMQREFK